jgi:hypothetical protein
MGADAGQSSLGRSEKLMQSSMTLNLSAARFAPMRRLLSGEDEDFLIRQGFRREASQLRSHHRKLFFRFVDMLQKDFITAHEARKAAMAENWDFEALLKERFTASYCLWAMRAAGVMHWVHVPQAGSVAQAYCERMQSFIAAGSAEPVAVQSF